MPDTLCSVSGASGNFHTDDEFCGRTEGVKGKNGGRKQSYGTTGALGRYRERLGEWGQRRW